MLGCELWEENFEPLLAVVKEYVSDLWEVRNVKLYGDPCPTQPHSQPSAGDPRDATVVERHRRIGKFSQIRRLRNDSVRCNTSKTGSPQTLGCVVNGKS